MKKICILVGLIVILMVTFICGCIQQSQLEFSSGPCEHHRHSYNQSNLGVKEINWLDDTTLQVKAYVRINCGEEIESGNYKITGNKITLRYKSPSCDELCMKCMCNHKLTYKFSDLEKKDYQFELERIK